MCCGILLENFNGITKTISDKILEESFHQISGGILIGIWSCWQKGLKNSQLAFTDMVPNEFLYKILGEFWFEFSDQVLKKFLQEYLMKLGIFGIFLETILMELKVEFLMIFSMVYLMKFQEKKIKQELFESFQFNSKIEKNQHNNSCQIFW